MNAGGGGTPKQDFPAPAHVFSLRALTIVYRSCRLPTSMQAL